MQNEVKVFLVEDDPFITKLLKKEIEKKGWTMDNDDTGEKAFEKIKASVPSIVILDIMLPGTDGMTVLKSIKGDEVTKNIPVLMLSNLSEIDKIEEARDIGAAKFLLKATSSMATIIAEIEVHIPKA